MLNSLLAITVLSGILSLLFFIAAIASLHRKAFLNSLMRLLVAVLMLSLAALFGTLMIASKGYRALIHEEVAAVVRIEPQTQKSFTAHFTFPDGHQTSFALTGDQLYVDAYILKWKPMINILGLHTAYELDRVGGRYLDLEEEKSKPRMLFNLSKPKPIDLLNLRQKYLFLRWFLDAEYGSATFIGSEKEATYEIRISTSGLLMREVHQKQN
ncbi:MAG: hypothetical protein R6W75_02030 [Smithellaceae bacterium]